jgi:hypothetical protein
MAWDGQHHGDTQRLAGAEKRWCDRSGSFQVCYGYGGEILKGTTVMVHAQALERVYGLAGMVRVLDAEVEV